MRSVGGVLVAASLLLVSSVIRAPAIAQIDSREGIALQNQIYQLRQELKALQDQMVRGGGAAASRPPVYTPSPQSSGSGDLVAQLLTRVDSLEEQVRQLRGRIDETQNQVQRQQADLGKRIDDLTFQIGQQGGPGSAPATPPRSAEPGPAPRSALPAPSPAPAPNQPQGPVKRTPELALQEGNAALGRRDYTTAEADAREVLANRTSPRAYDAQLLLAQSLSGQRQYAQAAIAYDDAYNRSRKGAHAQDALLGLAGSLAAINEKKASCDTLNRLRSEFPQPRPDIRDGMSATAQKAGCR
jgi:TolA-binding protein